MFIATMETIDGRDLPSRDGFDLRLDILNDPDAHPREVGTIAQGGCYSDVNMAAYDMGLWQYVVQRVTASCAGVELGTAYLGAVEHGDLGEGFWVDALAHEYYVEDLTEEALTEARANVTAISETVTEVEE